MARKFVTLGHPVINAQGETLYEKGTDDVYFVLFWIIASTFLRAFVMNCLLEPLANWRRMENGSKTQRFCEQGWSFVYYTSSWPLGMYIMYNSDYWLDTRHFWIGYPHLAMPWLFKFYYLSQIGFWLQQFFVLHVEKRRKDYVEMFFHHILTNTLLIATYYTNFTRVGNTVLSIMDFADIFLSFAKMMRYLRFQKVCDVTFVIFVVVWFVTRHVLCFWIAYSAMTEPELYREFKWDPANGVFYTETVRYIFLGLFALLQLVLIFWSYLIVKVVYRVVSGNSAHDNRSDSEDPGRSSSSSKKHR
ncbi:Sphingosine N-acyltransferase lag1 [Dispira simplex]|nr:Sphingosine N-acyltransferase lag1 [Dispira simplex]